MRYCPSIFHKLSSLFTLLLIIITNNYSRANTDEMYRESPLLARLFFNKRRLRIESWWKHRPVLRKPSRFFENFRKSRTIWFFFFFYFSGRNLGRFILAIYDSDCNSFKIISEFLRAALLKMLPDKSTMISGLCSDLVPFYSSIISNVNLTAQSITLSHTRAERDYPQFAGDLQNIPAFARTHLLSVYRLIHDTVFMFTSYKRLDSAICVTLHRSRLT